MRGRELLLAHKFNNDLLLTEHDRDLARDAFPAAFHILDNAPLREFFLSLDVPAKANKARSRIAGVTSVCFASISLWLAAGEPLYRQWSLSDRIAIFAALLAIASVVIGLGGVFIVNAKKGWLYRRIATERIPSISLPDLHLSCP